MKWLLHAIEIIQTPFNEKLPSYLWLSMFLEKNLGRNTELGREMFPYFVVGGQGFQAHKGRHLHLKQRIDI